MFRFPWRALAAAFFMMGACTAPGIEENRPNGEAGFDPPVVEDGQDERELESDETFCAVSEGQVDWRQCAFNTTSGSQASYVANAVPLESFTMPDGSDFPIESPFTPAVAHLPDGRRMMVGTEWLRSTGLWCGLLEEGGSLPVDCPADWFVELRHKPLHQTPLLGELDGVPGLDLFVAELDFGEFGGAPQMLQQVGLAFGMGTVLPNFAFIPHYFTYVDGRWIDISEERGFLGSVVMVEKLAIGFDYVDLDSDGWPEIVTRFMSRAGSGTPVWRWRSDEDRFELRTDLAPAGMKVSFYGIFRGPTSPEGVVDFVSIGNAQEVLPPGELGSTFWRGETLATAQPVPGPLGAFAGSPMGMAMIDTRRDGCANMIVSDVGTPGYCEDFEDPFTIMDPCWERQDAIPMTETDWGDEPVSWSVVSTDFNGDGWPDAALAHSWHIIEEHWNQQLVILMNDGQGNFLRYRDSEEASVAPFALPAQERSLVVTSAGDAPPDLMSFSINREGVEGSETERYLGNPFATAQVERIELRGSGGAYACGAYVQAYGPGDEIPTLIGAPCTGGGFGGFYPPQVWVPADTERVTVIWTDGSTKEVVRASSAGDSGYFPQIIQAD